jgi:hypothetical protein
VYMTLLLYENTRTRKCWPSYHTIGKMSGLNKSAISRSLKHIKELGAIKVQGQYGRHSTYEMCAIFRETSPQNRDRFRLRKCKRDSKGRYQSLNRQQNQSLNRQPTGPQNRDTNSYKNPMNITPPLPPTGETTHTPPIISKKTIEELKKVMGADELRRYMEDHGYPLFYLNEDQENITEGEEANNSCVPTTYSGVGENANEERP